MICSIFVINTKITMFLNYSKPVLIVGSVSQVHFVCGVELPTGVTFPFVWHWTPQNKRPERRSCEFHKISQTRLCSSGRKPLWSNCLSIHRNPLIIIYLVGKSYLMLGIKIITKIDLLVKHFFYFFLRLC